ncbi:hypothetical protein CDAR_192781, partial [Caerostris darwini]
MQTTEGSRSLTLETCFPAPFPEQKHPTGASAQVCRPQDARRQDWVS